MSEQTSQPTSQPTDDLARVEFLAADLTRRAGSTRADVTVEHLAGLPHVRVAAASGAGFTALPWGNSTDAWAIFYSHDDHAGNLDAVVRMVMPTYDQASAYMYGLMAAMPPAPF